MSSMLREILRWRDHGRRDSSPDCWTNWANSVAERYSHFFSRYGALARHFALPATTLLLRVERWQHYAWNLSPQIKLAISPLLLETVWKTSPPSLDGAVAKDFLRTDMPKDRTAGAAQSDVAIADEADAHNNKAQEVSGFGRAAEPLSAARPIMINREITIDRQKAGAREGSTPDEPQAELATPFNLPSPLERVFRRARADETQQQPGRTLLADESYRLVDRTAQKRVRIESAVERSTVVQRQRREITVADEMEGRFQKSSAGRTGVAFDQPPVINVAELTEQVVREIDNRIVAQRERLGRSF